MSIASGIINPQEYFEKCLEFLQKYSWIYETSNTCFIRDNVLDKFPREWVEYFSEVNTNEMNHFPGRKLKTNKPHLDEFIQELDILTPYHAQIYIPHVDYKFKKISPKKQHEISKLSVLIQSVCGDEIDVLIDFGSGLGYLSELLYRSNDYKILGIESDPSRVRTSNERQAAIYPASKRNVVFKEHFITNDSHGFIQTHVQEITTDQEDPKLAIIGLHACADLTINSMKLFLQMDNVQKLIIMPCCYHKLEIQSETNKSCFKNFPLSRALKDATTSRASFNGFNRPFLRLACQQTSARWRNLTEQEHLVHSTDMFLRGVVEAILREDEMVMKSKSKRTIDHLSFSELCSAYELRSKTTKEQLTWTSEHDLRFSELIRKYPNGPQLAEGLTCLQATMQQLCENLVLYDRLCYMKEQAAENNHSISVKFEKIMDELLSPRCFVLIAEKL